MDDAVLFRVDAGASIGLGHLSRCVALAEGLRRRGVASVMLIPPADEVQGRVKAAGHAVAISSDRSGSRADLDATMSAARQFRCRAVVLDSYQISEQYMKELRANDLFVVAIDDLAAHAFPVQVVVNGGAQADQLNYQTASGDTRFLLGTKYALVRPEFWSVPVRVCRSSVEHVLLTVGGDDPLGVTPQVLRAIDSIEMSFSVSVVIGPFSVPSAELQRVAERSRRRVSFVRAPDTLLPLMLEADLAIAAGGQTLYELAATGTPTVALALFENQIASVRALAAAGVVRAGAAMPGGTSIGFVADVTTLLQDSTARRAMSAAGQSLVDGCGPARVAAEMSVM